MRLDAKIAVVLAGIGMAVVLGTALVGMVIDIDVHGRAGAICASGFGLVIACSLYIGVREALRS